MTEIYRNDKMIHCEDTGETMSGDKYLNSNHWKQLRKQVYDYYHGKCQECGDHIPLSVANVHHRIYKRMGHEKITDLILYCNHCHACIHSKRKDGHIVNGDLQTLLGVLTREERKEAFDLLLHHFNLDECYIQEVKEKQKEKGRKKIEKKQKQRQKKEEQRPVTVVRILRTAKSNASTRKVIHKKDGTNVRI